MMILRSLLFNILFYVGTALLSLILLPALLLPPRAAALVGIFWGWLTNLFLRLTVGITHQMKGDMHADTQVIYAAKHQSAWETMTLCWRLDGPVIVLKKELTKIPVVGWLMSHSGAIAVDRSAGMKALKKMRIDAIAAKKTGRDLRGNRPSRHPSGFEFRGMLGATRLCQKTGQNHSLILATD